VILTAAVIFALAVFLSYLAVNYLLRPLAAMGAVAQRVADGRYDRPFQRPGTDEIGRIMAVFNTMTEQLAEQKQREEKLHALERRAILSETAAVLAHEIRNPLNLINLTAGHMARQFLPEDPKSRETYLGLTENLKAQVAHLNTMVGEFLTAGKPTVLKKQTVALRALIEQTGVLARQKWAVRDIRLENAMDESVTAFVDPEQMRLVFLNLFINAAEAIGQGGTIGVAVASQPGQLVIRVYDTGPGIEEQYLEKIFEPYFMKRPDGTGLGLTLVRRIVEEHGGTVTARNREEGGMCFTITLPRKEPA